MVDWNKEISLARKDRAGTENSIWKKEISFGRKPKEAAAPEAVVAEPVVVEPVAVEPVVAVPSPAEPEPAVLEPAALEPAVFEPAVFEPGVPEPVAQAPAVETPQPPLEPLVAAEPAVAPEPLVMPPVEVEVIAAETVVNAEPEPEPLVESPPAVAPEPALVEIEAEPATAADAAPPQSGDYGWLTQDMEATEQAPAHVSAPVPVPVELTPAAVAAEPPTLDAPAAEPVEARAPFWKKDVSFSRKPKAERPAKAPKPPKGERAGKEKKEKSERSVPFWKKDVSFGKKAAPKVTQAQAEQTEQAEQAPPVAKAKSVPFWKKDFSFGKKADKAPERKQAPGVKRVPFWKQNLSCGHSPDAARSAPIDRGAAKKKGKKNKKEMVVGLKIGASQLAAARVNNNGSPELVQVARAPLDDGIIVGGELRDPETLAVELAAFFAKHKLPKRNVRLGIANNRIGVRTFEINGIDDPRQLANAIRFRAQETLPIPLEEAVLDWQVLSETQDEDGGTTRRVLLVVAYRELVDRYVAACKKAGLKLSGIDLEAFAMLRAVIPPPPPGSPDPDGASVVVNVGHDRSTLAVSDGHVCEFTRVLSWGGQSLSVAIARAIDMTPSEVEPLKRSLVLGGNVSAPDSFSQEQTDAAADAVTRELQAFARELVSSLRFYQNQPGSLGIQQIILTGGTSHFPGLAAELERLIGVAVRVGDPLGRVKIGKRIKDPEQVGSFTVAVGLGIDD